MPLLVALRVALGSAQAKPLSRSRTIVPSRGGSIVRWAELKMDIAHNTLFSKSYWNPTTTLVLSQVFHTSPQKHPEVIWESLTKPRQFSLYFEFCRFLEVGVAFNLDQRQKGNSHWVILVSERPGLGQGQDRTGLLSNPGPDFYADQDRTGPFGPRSQRSGLCHL